MNENEPLLLSDFAALIEDVAPRGADGILQNGAALAMSFGHGREHDQPGRDDEIAQCEDEDGEPDARARLGGAVNDAAIQ